MGVDVSKLEPDTALLEIGNLKLLGWNLLFLLVRTEILFKSSKLFFLSGSSVYIFRIVVFYV